VPANGRCQAVTANAGKPQPMGYGGKPFVTLKESSAIQFILEYFHPAGALCFVRITRLPMHGRLQQALNTGNDLNHTLITLAVAPFDMSSDPFASLVRRGCLPVSWHSIA
jgi:hypothetical protein